MPHVYTVSTSVLIKMWPEEHAVEMVVYDDAIQRQLITSARIPRCIPQAPSDRKQAAVRVATWL